MRCEFSEHEWTAIKPMLPNKPRDLPATYGPRTTCYNRYLRWMMVLSR